MERQIPHEIPCSSERVTGRASVWRFLVVLEITRYGAVDIAWDMGFGGQTELGSSRGLNTYYPMESYSYLFWNLNVFPVKGTDGMFVMSCFWKLI